MNERQRRADEARANAVARGLNIMAVRNATLARRYMEYKEVPANVIARVLTLPQQRRRVSVGQLASEAITPMAPDDQP